MTKYRKKFIFEITNRPSLYLFVFIIIFSIDRHHRYECSVNPENGPFYSDVFEYYSFLPEYFLDFRQVPEQNVHTTRRTVGMAIMYAPAFFVGHLKAKMEGAETDGYSPPYHWSIRWGSIIYCIIGLAFCRKNLLYFFKEPVVAIAMACIFFGTNLFYYTYGWGELPHSYLFFLYSAFIFFTLKWLIDRKGHFLIWLCLTGGIITLIRPTGILVFLFPLLYDIHSLADFKVRLKMFFEDPLTSFYAFCLFVLPLVFQMFIWKFSVGQFVYYSYGNERFFFNDPQLINFLLSYRKGWLIYTPIMSFAVLGIILSVKRMRSMLLFISIYFLATIYVLSSWWEWSYGGSFGCRALIESYAFLAFPFAVFVSWIWELKSEKMIGRLVIKPVLLFSFYLLIELNLFQTWQYKYGIIHYSGMTREAFTYGFLREDFSKEEMNVLRSKFRPPDAEKMLRGERDQ